MNENRKKAPGGGKKKKLLFLFLAILVFTTLALFFSPADQWVFSALQWLEAAGPTGMVVFVLFYILANLLFIPATLLILSAGFLFGLFHGMILVTIGSALGALFSFLISRYLARETIQTRIEGMPRFHAIEKAVSRQGFRVSLLTRLVPILPCALLNYSFGLTDVDARRFLLGTTLGMIPLTLAYVFVGSTAADLARATTMAENPDWLAFLFGGLGLLAALSILFLITRQARKELELLLEEEGLQEDLLDEILDDVLET